MCIRDRYQRRVHGGYSQRNQQTQIELNDNEKMIESELHAIGIRENIILDCCRVLLPGIIADAMENFGLRRTASATERRNLNKDECRRFYDKRISECSSGINVLYGCNILEKSGESTSGGGYYSSSLRKVANAWEDDKNRSLPSDKYVILSVPDAHNRAIPLVNNKKSNQNPQIIVNNGDLFPWAIASYQTSAFDATIRGIVAARILMSKNESTRPPVPSSTDYFSTPKLFRLKAKITVLIIGMKMRRSLKINEHFLMQMSYYVEHMRQ
eukprot:TRINITY_DN2236_c0_g1_i2.p2 TRINITY_DN2236_c0_g1~~TRINITY_DN2236_c0_g1_i2.p2  ORF type:complete len:269 (+),score=28.29 TRINITY_DN2236_c0_g1_i2:176-982(+)